MSRAQITFDHLVAAYQAGGLTQFVKASQDLDEGDLLAALAYAAGREADDLNGRAIAFRQAVQP